MSGQLIETRRGTDLVTRGEFLAQGPGVSSVVGGGMERTRLFSGLHSRMSSAQDQVQQILSGCRAQMAYWNALRSGVSSSTLDEDILDSLRAEILGIRTSSSASGGPRMTTWVTVLISEIGRFQWSAVEPRRLPIIAKNAAVETEDWELQIENLPSRPAQTVLVKFEKGLYRPPRIVDNPEE